MDLIITFFVIIEWNKVAAKTFGYLKMITYDLINDWINWIH